MPADYLRTNEEISNYCINNNIDRPQILIGDEVTLKSNSIEILESGLQHVSYNDDTILRMERKMGKKLKVLEKFKGQPIDDYPWWSWVKLVDEDYDQPIYLPDRLYDKHFDIPTYIPRNIKRTLESNKLNEDYFRNNIEMENIDYQYRPLLKIGDKVKFKENVLDTIKQLNSNAKIFPDNINFIKNNINNKFIIEEKFKYVIENNMYPWWSKLSSDDMNSYLPDMLLEKYDIPTYIPKTIKRTLESFEKFNKKVLYAFDLDDTLVYSDKFTDYIKPVLNENLTPLSIFNNELNKIDTDLEKLKYEHGRIYFDDPEKKVIIPNNSSWVRKKDRIYLTTPESYFLTNESMPNKINEKIVNLYNESDEVAIITARKELLRNNTLKTLDKLNIKIPNNGLFMYPSNSFSFKSKWKSEKLLELYKNFDEIHYFDDNIKLLKKIQHYLSKYNKNIYLYKVSNNTYRKIN